ncbi:MAG TPA: carboxypeptidase-like regulatory domain-containing protein, partial [Bacteroidia bacterium]|nr:carboxypeptidase-like regulatory domain-containing protein [Bacteroidia bacterium]
MKQVFPSGRILSLVICIFLTVLSYGQNVSGTVNNASGEPLEGAVVMLNGNTTQTDNAGQFSIPCGTLPATINVHLIGYKDYSGTVSDCNAKLVIQMTAGETSLQVVDINDSSSNTKNLAVANAS